MFGAPHRQDHIGITSYSQLEVVHAIPGLNKSFHPRHLRLADGGVRAELTRLREHQCRRQMCKAGAGCLSATARQTVQ